MIYQGNKTVAAAGTAVPLKSTRTPAQWISIYPLATNTDQVRIGGIPTLTENGGTAAIPSGKGMPLNVGDAGVTWPMGGTNNYDLNTIYVDANVSGEGVQFVYGRR